MSLDALEGVLLDVSDITNTIDPDYELSPLAWQYVIERLLVEKHHFTICSSTPYCKSLNKQYASIRTHTADILRSLSVTGSIELTCFITTIYMTRELLIITCLKKLEVIE